MGRTNRLLSLETLADEGRFILRTLLRDDLFGERVRLTEAERVIAKSITLSFADYCAFLAKHGYVRLDQLANVVEVSDEGRQAARAVDDADFHERLAQHFARELGATPKAAPPPPPPPAAVAAPLRVERVEPVETRVEDPLLDRRYRKGEVLGAGPIGEVFEAEHVALARRVAIKEARSVFQYVSYIRRDEIVRRLRAAVQAQAALNHPHIVSILDVNTEREFPYLVMELAEGGDLRRRLEAAEEGRLDVQVTVRVLLQLAYALQHAHSQGVLHLGLKPENVLFDRFGNAKLADFGLSTVMDREEGASQIPVLVGSGTVAYMPPERLQPDPEQLTLGPAADIYSLGILTYQMLTGKLPGRRSPLPSQARKGKEVPAGFDDVFDRMTRDDVGERYRSMDEVLAGLYKAFSGKEVFGEGTILSWARDPAPLPERTSVPPEAPPKDADKTGEVDVSEYVEAPAE